MLWCSDGNELYEVTLITGYKFYWQDLRNCLFHMDSGAYL